MAKLPEKLQNLLWTSMATIGAARSDAPSPELGNVFSQAHSPNTNSVNSVRSAEYAGQGAKNKYGPYMTPYSVKSEYPIRRAANLYNAIPEGESTVSPADWMRSRAGDPDYFKSAMGQMMRYVDNPENGWVKQNNGTYVNSSTGQMFNPNLLSASVETPLTVYKRPNVAPLYFMAKRYAAIPSSGSDIPGLVNTNYPMISRAYQQGPDSVIDPATSSTFRAYDNATKNYSYPNISLTNHEINHAMTMPYTLGGLMYAVRDPKTGTFDSLYHKNVSELVNAASMFQQQHYRNTGSRITSKDGFWSEIDEAKRNIQDYDPESRRFLQSIDILQNQAPADDVSADMLMQIQEAMPLISRSGRLPGYNRNYRSVG